MSVVMPDSRTNGHAGGCSRSWPMCWAVCGLVHVRSFMAISWNRILSASLAVVYIVAAYCGRGAGAGFIIATFVILPLACIWFSDAMGGYIGPAWHGSITAPTPGLAVCIAGWFLLLLPLVIGIVYALTSSKA